MRVEFIKWLKPSIDQLAGDKRLSILSPCAKRVRPLKSQN